MGKERSDDAYVRALSERLSAVRSERGWTLDELSRRTERGPVSVERVSAMEAGEACELEELERVLDALNPPPRARSSLLASWRPGEADSTRGERLGKWRAGVRVGRGAGSTVGLEPEALAVRTGVRIGLTTLRHVEEGRVVPSVRLMGRIVGSLEISGDLRTALMAWASLGTRDVEGLVEAAQELDAATTRLSTEGAATATEAGSSGDEDGWRDEVRRRRLPARGTFPPSPPLAPSTELAGRVRAALWGLAIGDALAWPHTHTLLHRRPAPIEGYGRDGGSNSVDGQLNWLTLRYLASTEGLEPDGLMQALTSTRVLRLGPSQARAFSSYLTDGDWRSAGVRSASIGGVSRILPLVLPHLCASNDQERLWEDVAVATILTHDDDATVAASAGVAHLFMEALRWPLASPTPAGWWMDRFLEVVTRFPARLLTPGQSSELRLELSDEGRRTPARVSLATVVADLAPRLESGWGLDRVAARYGSGYYLVEAIPCLLATLERHGHDPQAALLTAVNLLRGSDSIACLVGALMGARHGMAAFREAWLEEHSGRLGELNGLIERAVERYVVVT